MSFIASILAASMALACTTFEEITLYPGTAADVDKVQLVKRTLGGPADKVTIHDDDGGANLLVQIVLAKQALKENAGDNLESHKAGILKTLKKFRGKWTAQMQKWNLGSAKEQLAARVIEGMLAKTDALTAEIESKGLDGDRLSRLFNDALVPVVKYTQYEYEDGSGTGAKKMSVLLAPLLREVTRPPLKEGDVSKCGTVFQRPGRTGMGAGAGPGPGGGTAEAVGGSGRQ